MASDHEGPVPAPEAPEGTDAAEAEPEARAEAREVVPGTLEPRRSNWPIYAFVVSVLCTVGFAFLSLNLFLRTIELEARLADASSTSEERSTGLESTLEEIRHRLEGHAQRLATATDRVAELERDLAKLDEELAKPQGFLPLGDLLPRRYPGSMGGDLEVPGSARLFAVALRQPDTTPYDSYRLDVLDAGGQRLIIERDLRRSRQGGSSFLVALPTARFATGHYVLRVLGVGSGSPKPLGEYELDLTILDE